MPENIDHYLPEFDEEGLRERLSGRSRDELLEMLIRSSKQTRLFAKMADELYAKLDQIEALIQERSALLDMPRIPGPDDIRRMLDE